MTGLYPMNEPHFSKYLVVMDKSGAERAIVFARELHHASVVPPGTVPVSAGFAILSDGEVIIPHIDSTSLGIGPRAIDRRLLKELLNR